MQLIPAEARLREQTLVLDNMVNVLTLNQPWQQHGSVALQFPRWTDGRAYSQAVLLRCRLRYAGELIATGDVLADMLPLLRRCGFSAAQLRADQSLQTAHRVLGWQASVYQDAPGDRAAATP